MKIMNIKKLYLLGCSSLLIATALPSLAVTLDVTFTANIRETTCDMAIEGGSGDGQNNTIPIGTGEKVSMDKIVNGDSAAQTTFKLKITECPSSLAALKTTVSGTQSALKNTALDNESTDSAAASYIGLTIARTTTPDAPFVIGSTTDNERLVWSTTEIANKEVPLVATLIETSSGKGTTGPFSALATFNFTYE
ncbi:fimbrial protein [Citrobacter youngae]|nr:fimbrial protein [Citrobacter youngae]